MAETNTSEIRNEKKSIRVFGSLQACGIINFEPKIRKIFEEKGIKTHWEIMAYLKLTPESLLDTVVLAGKSLGALVSDKDGQSPYQSGVTRPLSYSALERKECDYTDQQTTHQDEIRGDEIKVNKSDDISVPIAVIRGPEMDIIGAENSMKCTSDIVGDGPMCIYAHSHPVVIASNIPSVRIDAHKKALARAEALRRINGYCPTTSYHDMTDRASCEECGTDEGMCAVQVSDTNQVRREFTTKFPLDIQLVVYSTKTSTKVSSDTLTKDCDSIIDVNCINKHIIVQKTVCASLEAISVKAAEIKVNITTEDIRHILRDGDGEEDIGLGEPSVDVIPSGGLDNDSDKQQEEEGDSCSMTNSESTSALAVCDSDPCANGGHTYNSLAVYVNTNGVTDRQRGNNEYNEKNALLCGYAEVHVSFADLSSAVIPVVSVRPDANVMLTVELLKSNNSLLSNNVNRVTHRQITDFIYDIDFLPMSSRLNRRDVGSHGGHRSNASKATDCNNMTSSVGLSVKKWKKSPVVVPYGCMPLDELYSHFVTFFAIMFGEGIEVLPSGKRLIMNDNTTNHITTENIKCSKQCGYVCNSFMSQLRAISKGANTADISCSPAFNRDPLTGQYRWECVRSMSLLHYILGDKKVLPVLSLLMCCKGLEHLDLEQNALSVMSMKRIQECLKVHPSVRSIVLKGNNFYESAGEEVLRLLKNNSRIVLCDIGSGVPSSRKPGPSIHPFTGISNAIHFSDKLKKRIEHYVNNVNHEALQQDGYNFLSQNYAYLSSAEDIPLEAWYNVLRVWGLLSVYPGTQGTQSTVANGDVKTKGTEEYNDSFIHHFCAGSLPKSAAAPLFGEAMRNVQIEMQMNGTDDRIILDVFRDYSRTSMSLGVCPYAVHNDETENAANCHLQNRVRCAMQCGIISTPNEAASMLPCYIRSYSRMLVLPMEVGLQALSRSKFFNCGTSSRQSTDLSHSSCHFMETDYSRRKWNDCVMALQALGQVQYSMGVRPQHYMHANEAFIKWMDNVLGPTSFDSTTRASFLQVLALVCRAVTSGTPLAIHTVAVIS